MTDSEKVPEQQLKQKQHQIQNHLDGLNGDGGEDSPLQPKQIIAEKVTGTVKWFNVKSGYGFINRNDTKEDVFVHQTAIIKNNPKKAVRSVGDGEVVEFDVVLGDKGNEAANVTGPEGEAVRGSPFAADKRRGFRLWRQRARRRSQKSDGDGGDENGNDENAGSDGEKKGNDKRRRFRPRRGRFTRNRNQKDGDGNNDEGGESGDGSGDEGGRRHSQQNDSQNGRRRFFRRGFRQRRRKPEGERGEGGERGDGGEGKDPNNSRPPRRRPRNRPKKTNGADGQQNE